MSPPHPVIVKVGGSLFDLPDLGPRLRRWLDALPSREVILIPGGGATVEVIRDLDRCHGLGDETSHWLALRMLSVQAHCLAALLPNAVVVECLAACSAVWRQDQVAVLDAHAFARADDTSAGALPHSWAATSDSLAARVALVAGAQRLILLKSVTIPRDMGWTEAGRRGFVDDCFAEVLAHAGLQVEAINFRQNS